ncbi:hypothetical protein BU16DRAFT_559202 [Lophium mytilinum]|uniref:Uncharacterized protein n=1 Tax=Lophium mytilinum TaxID=390894 RepID=A0A6A6QZM1_9PEZI|nr:hypothetical protein BU16DRAFT_559202 [Lophium mytilinum]
MDYQYSHGGRSAQTVVLWVVQERPDSSPHPASLSPRQAHLPALTPHPHTRPSSSATASPPPLTHTLALAIIMLTATAPRQSAPLAPVRIGLPAAHQHHSPHRRLSNTRRGLAAVFKVRRDEVWAGTESLGRYRRATRDGTTERSQWPGRTTWGAARGLGGFLI